MVLVSLLIDNKLEYLFYKASEMKLTPDNLPIVSSLIVMQFFKLFL